MFILNDLELQFSLIFIENCFLIIFLVLGSIYSHIYAYNCTHIYAYIQGGAFLRFLISILLLFLKHSVNLDVNSVLRKKFLLLSSLLN